MRLSDRVALVTGASRGIGRAIALELAREGAHVAVNYRKQAGAAADTVRAIAALGRRAVAVGPQLVAGIPLGRAGQPEEIGKLAAFLASDDAAWIGKGLPHRRRRRGDLDRHGARRQERTPWTSPTPRPSRRSAASSATGSA
jgi:NAD(P)-dependent dehydrogenase (short-subunit alcohol dehydrogenase family)